MVFTWYLLNDHMRVTWSKKVPAYDSLSAPWRPALPILLCYFHAFFQNIILLHPPWSHLLACLNWQIVLYIILNGISTPGYLSNWCNYVKETEADMQAAPVPCPSPGRGSQMKILHPKPVLPTPYSVPNSHVVPFCCGTSIHEYIAASYQKDSHMG